MQHRTFQVTVADDDLHEPAETFYVGLIAAGSKNISALHGNKAAVTIEASDALGSNAQLADIHLRSGSSEFDLALSPG